MRRSVLTTPALLVALSVALTACGGGGEKAAETPAETPAGETAAPTVVAGLDGKAEYLICQTCHQENGEGLPNLYPPLAGSDLLTGDPSIPIAIILHGMQGEVEVKGQKYNNVMAPWASLPRCVAVAVQEGSP